MARAPTCAHTRGNLNDAEFAAAKRRLLSGHDSAVERGNAGDPVGDFFSALASGQPCKCWSEARSAQNAHYSTTAQMYDACIVTCLHIHRFQRRGRTYNGPD